MEYNFRDIEQKWQKRWVEMHTYRVKEDEHTYRVKEDETKKKFYVLNMFPYPSGAGLHVGHPLGYIASDIYARYKRQQGYNVLNPMGYDAYGLPAEQYAIQTGQHPEKTTFENINRYRSQLDKIGFSCWTRLASRSIGNVRFAPATPFTISGRSGLSSACLSRILASHPRRLSLPSS